ncbi:KEOPS complex Pcc1-like subunit [Sulfolobales archaeon HS-7]|nr:KEOPS complex Pcc1-like subunit [Sulfolobales archaeon HS-7]
MPKIIITIEKIDPELEKVIERSIIIEDIDRQYVKVSKEPLSIKIEGSSYSRIRAIVNSYISWINTIILTINKLEEIESGGKNFT